MEAAIQLQAQKLYAAAAPGAVSVRASCGTNCSIPATLADKSTTIKALLDEAAADGSPPDVLPLDQVSVSDLGALLLLDGDSDACRRMSAGQPGRLLRAFSVASFIGCADLRRNALISLAGLLHGSSGTEMERVCGVDDGFPFGPAVTQLVGLADLSETHLAELSARVAVHAEQNERQQVAVAEPEPEPEAAGKPEPETAGEPVAEVYWTTLHLEQTDADTILGLLAALDIATCLRLASASFAACSALFLDHRFAFRAWSAVLQPISSVGITMVEAGVDQAVDLLSAEVGEGCDWCQQLIELIRMSQEVLTLNSGLLTLNAGSDQDAEAFEWLTTRAGHIGSPSNAQQLLIARVLVPQMTHIVYALSSKKPSTGGSSVEDVYQLARRVIHTAAERASKDAAAQLQALEEGAPPDADAGADALPVTAEARAVLDGAWQRCAGAHRLQCAAFGYLDRFHTGRNALPSLVGICAEATAADGLVWQAYKARGWSAPLVPGTANSDTGGGAAVHVPESLILVSSDGETFSVSIDVARRCGSLSAMVDSWQSTGGMPGGSIPVAVDSHILSKAIEFIMYLLKADADGKPEDVRNEWNQRFLDMDQGALFHLILASNALGIKPLVDLCCKAVADQMIGKTPEEIRAHFNIQNDFTPEEEEEVRRENAWCEDI